MSVSLSKRSLHNLEGVHDDLVRVVQMAAEECDGDPDFIITEGLRSIEQQKANVAKGVSQTMHSRHLGGFAIDFVALSGGRVTYNEPEMEKLANLFLRCAQELNIPVIWGGVWKSLHDTPHIELARARYPDA
jgi:peptidoglycan L-alanyl-D-glutamate endopeptidase CwlK